MSMRTPGVVAAAILAALCVGKAAAQEGAADFPSRPIKIIVPFGPGASNDTIARLAAAHASDILKQPVVVENRTGASGDIGMALAAKSKPDGYTILMTSNAATVSTATKKRPAIDMLKDLQPLVMVGVQPMLLVAAPNIGFDSFAAFVNAAKAAPEKYSYATPGAGTPHHLTFELISGAKGLKMIHVPFAGTGQSLNEVLADRVSLALATTSSAGPFVQQGRLKVLGVVSKRRLKEYPTVPTLIEGGLADLESGFWYGFTVPSGVPPAIAAKLTNALNVALSVPSVKEQIRKMDIDMNPLQGPMFGGFIAADYRKWRGVAQKSGIAIE